MGSRLIVKEEHNRKICAAVIWVFLIFTLLFPHRSQPVSAASKSPKIDDGLIFLPVIYQPYPLPLPGEPGYCLTAEEVELAGLINDYRISNGLPAAPLSRSLSSVAQWHVRDLDWNQPNSGKDVRGLECNGHSWSDQGYWLPVCYTSDHTYASGMWNKPKEITRGIYTDTGFEIAMGASWWQATAEAVFLAWKNSPGHQAVMLEQDVWSGKRWPAMGVGIYRGYAVTWFSSSYDPMGTILACGG